MTLLDLKDGGDYSKKVMCDGRVRVVEWNTVDLRPRLRFAVEGWKSKAAVVDGLILPQCLLISTNHNEEDCVIVCVQRKISNISFSQSLFRHDATIEEAQGNSKDCTGTQRPSLQHSLALYDYII